MKFHKFNAKTILQNQSSRRDLLIRTYVTLIKSSNDEIFTLIVKFEGFYQSTFFKRHFSNPSPTHILSSYTCIWYTK